ncbi:glycoside hydrolase family 16 protein [Kitasatospora sp. NBC_01287]|uniref:glycoside hydrolase family 16 protein n=1 Tax=Kitasatospora sp. NBC_01287 TaxID=2903573 RepID=UPI002250F561|nr:glycoside hydrolase family 16 protein [Kitasatospora sp. NBC_01287]MCX4749930.1 glycoside hydrolase family 16 protein [Kitasatospora sp. NBC_01287]
MNVRVRIALALTGWLALLATALPAGHPVRIGVLVAFVLCCPGAAAVRPRARRRAGAADVLEDLVLAVVLSLALGALVAEAFYLNHAFTVRRALLVLAVLTSLLALRPERWRPWRRRGRGAGAGAAPAGARSDGPRSDGPQRRGAHGAGPVRRVRRPRRVLGPWAALAGALLLTAGCASATGSATTDASPAAPGNWHQVFGDDFNGRSLDHARWATCYDWNNNGCTNGSNHEQEWYQPSQVTVGGGSATLTAQRHTTQGTDGVSHPWTSGMITTGRDSWFAQPRETFTYGYFAAALRIPAQAGMFPAFWLLPDTRVSPPELDIAEFPEITQQVQLNVHWPGPTGADQSAGSTFGPVDFPAGTHVFALDWEPNSLTWYVDGVQRWQQTDPGRIPHVPMELIVNLAVGYPAPAPASVDSAALRVDWVRVWQH